MMTTVLKLVAQPAFRSLTINSCLALALTLGTQSIRANDQTRADDSLERLIAAADSDPTKADFAAIWSAAVTRYKVRDITEVKVLLSEWDARALGPDMGAQCKYQIDRLESARQKFYFSLALQKRSLECAEQTGDATRAASREALIAALLKYLLRDGSGQSWHHPIAQVVHQDADALADLAGLELMSRLYNMRDNGEMRLIMRLRAPEQPEKTWYFDPLQLPLAMARAQGRTVADYPGYTLHLIARLQGEQLSHGDPGGLVTYARSLQPSTLETAKEALAVWQSVRSLSPADGVVGMTELCLWKVELDCLGAAIDGLLDLAPQANSEVLATLAALNHRGVGMKRDKKAGEALLNKAMQQGDRGDVLNQYANVLGINTLWQMGAEGGLIQITTPSRARRDALAALSRAADAGNATAMVMSVTLAGKDGSVHAYRKALDKLETTNASDDPTILFFFAMNNAFFPTSEPDYGTKLQESMRRALDAGVGAAGLALYSFSKDPALNLTLEHPAIHYLRQGARLGDSESIKTLLDESPEMPIGEAVNWLYGLMLRSEEGALGDCFARCAVPIRWIR